MSSVFLQGFDKLNPFSFPFNHPLSFFPLVIFIIGLCKWLFTNTVNNTNLPPSPPRVPILGNLHQLGKLPHRSLRSMSRRYGPLMSLRIGSKPALVVSSANAAQEILKNHDLIFSNRPKITVASIILYDGKDVAFANYGEYWRQMKSICVLQLFSNKKIRSFRAIREEETGLMMQMIKRSLTVSSVPMDLSEMITGQTNAVICRAAFGRKYAGQEGIADIKKILADFSEALGTFSMGDFIPWLGWIDKLTGLEKNTRRVAKSLDGFVEKILQEHTLIEWAMTELLRHPQVMEKLKAVTKETLRLHPPLPLLVFRESSQDVKICGYDIASRTQVIINAWAIQRDPAYWEEPEKFRPERFLTSSIDFKGQHFEFIPFGAGRRGCPAAAFSAVNVLKCLKAQASQFTDIILFWPSQLHIHLPESIAQELITIWCRSNTKMLSTTEQSLAVTLPFILFLFFLCKWLHSKSSTAKKSLPPSPPKLPVLGNLHQLGTHPHRSLRSLSQQHGELMLIYLGSKPILIVSSAEAATEIMKTRDAIFSGRPQTKTTNKLLYNSKNVGAAPYGEYWRQMKSICVLQLLSNTRVRSFSGIRREEMNLLMGKIQNSTLSMDKVNLSEMFMTFTNDVICRVAFGGKYSGKKGGTDFKKLLREFVKLLGSFSVGDFIPLLAWITWINGFDSKVDRIAKEFDQFLEGVVKEHEDRQGVERKGDDADNNEKFKDFVDVLLDVHKNERVGFPISRDSIKALILDMFSGGTDTSYAVLEWAMTELLRHPAVMQELQKEVRGITGMKSHVTEDGLDQMEYLKAVIKETLRLHPPIPLLVPRRSTQEAKINGYEIPERFLNSHIDIRGQDFKLIPFGAGRRMCPGISFAMANNELVLANLIHKFDWTLPGGAKGETLDMSEYTGIAIHRKNPLLAVATPRR